MIIIIIFSDVLKIAIANRVFFSCLFLFSVRVKIFHSEPLDGMSVSGSMASTKLYKYTSLLHGSQ